MTAWTIAGWFRVAMRAQENGEYGRARRMYRKILQISPDHVSALHNLAVTELRLGLHKESRATMKRLRDNSKLEAAMHHDKWPELGYSVLYNRALAHMLASDSDDSETPQPQQALGPATGLAEQVLRRLDMHDRQSSFARLIPIKRSRIVDAEELLLLQKIELPSLALLAEAIFRCLDSDDAWRRAAEGTLERYPAETKRRALLDAVSARRLSREVAVTAEHYVRANARTDVRTQYNLACYRSRVLEALSGRDEDAQLCDELVAGAFDDLDRALPDEALFAWAQHDPALAVLRQHPEWTNLMGRHRTEFQDQM